MATCGDAALAVHVRPARAVNLHPLVHERRGLSVSGKEVGKLGERNGRMRTRTSDAGAEWMLRWLVTF